MVDYIALAEELIEDDDLLLLAVSGSHLYGLATPESDYDLRGISLAPLDTFVGLKTQHRDPWKPREKKDPDMVIHEFGKFCHLACSGNPMCVEQLFLHPEDVLYAQPMARPSRDTFYTALYNRRELFLSQRLFATYSGYAKSQIERAQRVEQGEEGVHRWKDRTRQKHIRHVFRLLQQGYDLLSTGTMEVRVSNRDELNEWAQEPMPKVIERFESLDNRLRSMVHSPLPDEPDYEKIDEWIIELRLDGLYPE